MLVMPNAVIVTARSHDQANSASVGFIPRMTDEAKWRTLACVWSRLLLALLRHAETSAVIGERSRESCRSLFVVPVVDSRCPKTTTCIILNRQPLHEVIRSAAITA